VAQVTKSLQATATPRRFSFTLTTLKYSAMTSIDIPVNHPVFGQVKDKVVILTGKFISYFFTCPLPHRMNLT
jgi:hypothetical protein